MNTGFGSGFVSGSFEGTSSGFGRGFFKPLPAPGPGPDPSPGVLFSNVSSYIANGTRALHGSSEIAVLGAVTRSNLTRTTVLKVTSTITVQGFKFIRTPESLGNWLTVSFDDMDAVVTVKSGGSINGGAISTKTFGTNSKARSATRTGLAGGQNVNTYRTEYDTYTVYDASPITLAAGTYQVVFRSTNTQIGVALLNRASVAIPTITSVYPDPDDAINASNYPVIEILSVAP